MATNVRWFRMALGTVSLFALLWLGCSPAADPTPQPTPTHTPAPTPTPQLAGAALGELLARQNGCTACHSTTGNVSVGPTWQGLFGRTRPLADGTEVTADEAYIRESILDPNARIAQGFQPNIMPRDFGQKLSTADIDAIMAYIQTFS